MVYCVQERSFFGGEQVDKDLLENLRAVTAEEQAFLDGATAINRDLYMQEASNVVNASKQLTTGKLITARPHTRFVHFPKHTHDYVEVIYMCSGETTHIINDTPLTLKEGALLFLNQSATHEVCKAGAEDIAVNFIILPDFFAVPLSMIGGEYTPLRKFLVDCLCEQNTGAGYLHFDVSQVKPIQNLLENLLWMLIHDTHNKLNVCQMTTALLLMELMIHTETLLNDEQENSVVFQVMQYVEVHYANSSFSKLAKKLRYEPSWLSREIKRRTGKTYTQLVQEKRLSQAAFLLRNTQRNISEIAVAVGYDNISYFHRIFEKIYGQSPRHYRLQERSLFQKL